MARQPLRPDIATAVRRAGTSTWGCGRALRRLEDHLGRGEKVRRIAGVRYRGAIGVAVLTDQRLIVVVESWMTRISDDFPYTRIDLVGWSTRWGAGTITLDAGGSTVNIYGVGSGIGATIVADLRQQLARIDRRRQLGLDRQNRLYGMVEHLYNLHIPDDTVEAIFAGDLADAPVSAQLPAVT